MRLLTVVGARPQFVKAAAFAEALRDSPEGIQHQLVHTGQHYDDAMSGVFFRDLGIAPPDINLNVGSGGHGEQTGEMLKRLEPVLSERPPDVVLVYGDTNSTLAAALCAAKLNIPIAHVEAGLRSYRRAMPEEINRVLTDRLSTLLFCPSEEAATNCAREGIRSGVHVVGDVMRDVMDLQRRNLPPNPAVEIGLEVGSYALATIHRAENTDDTDRLEQIMKGLIAIASTGITPVLPLHPRTRERINVDALQAAGITFIAPQPFASMVSLEAGAKLIVTDSGGVQKEALWLSVPCVTVRDETEWVETVESGWNQLVAADATAIETAATGPQPSGLAPDLYGDGHASRRILNALRRAFG